MGYRWNNAVLNSRRQFERKKETSEGDQNYQKTIAREGLFSPSHIFQAFSVIR
jgi:hypothetical protein